MKVVEQHGRIFALILQTLTPTLSTAISPALASDKRVVKIMTQNMDVGTDLLYFFVTDPISATQLT